MFLIITKWSPLVPGSKYLKFFTLEEISENDNQNPDGTNIVDPAYYNKEIYESWIASVFSYRDLLNLNTAFIYQFLETENSNVVYTAQMFLDKSLHDIMSVSDVYISHQAKRDELNQLLQISSEVKKIEVDIPTAFLNDYEMIESLFDLY
jgi:hypothetical protein